MTRYSVLLFVAVCCLGCASTESFWKVPNPFYRESDLDDPLYATTKTAQVEQIRAATTKAIGLSTAEKRKLSEAFAERLRGESDPVLKRELVKALGYFASMDSIEGLRHALRDPSPKIRIETCHSLAKLNSPQSLEMLAQVVQGDSNLDVRSAAIRGLGKFQSPEAIRALSVALESNDPALQYLAVQSMRRAHTEDLGNSVGAWKQLANRSTGARQAAVENDGDQR